MSILYWSARASKSSIGRLSMNAKDKHFEIRPFECHRGFFQHGIQELPIVLMGLTAQFLFLFPLLLLLLAFGL